MSAANIIGAFSEEHAAALSGVSRRQLRDWDRIGLLRPSYGADNRGLPYGRIYSFRDLVSLRVLSQLRNVFKCKVPHLLEVQEKLAALSDEPWAATTLHVLGKRVVINEPGSRRKVEVVSGQRVLDIPLRVVATGIKQAVAQLNLRGQDEIGKVVHGKFLAQNQPVIAGTRIPVVAVKSFAEAGFSTDEIAKEYPGLTVADICAAIAFEGDSAAA